MAPVHAAAGFRTVALPSNNSDGDPQCRPNEPNYEAKPHDYYYHEALARICKELLPPGTRDKQVRIHCPRLLEPGEGVLVLSSIGLCFPEKANVILFEREEADRNQRTWDVRGELYLVHMDISAALRASGGNVRFDTLPTGYATYLKTRNDSKHTDRYLYGHPKGKFDSPNKFAIHFKWLMGGQQGQCLCVNCSRGSKASAPRAPKASKATKMGTEAPQPITRTSIEQVKNAQKYVDLLYRQFHAKKKPVALEFTGGEPEGWEYRIFNQAEDYKPSILEAHSFEPRENEFVLFYMENLGLYFEETTQAIGQLKEDGEHGLIPQWQAGRIVHTPIPGKIGVDDLKYWKTDLNDTSKLFTVEVIPMTRASGVQLETYKLPLMNFRPFSMVAELLHGLPQMNWAKNIVHAATLSTSLSLVEPCAVWGLLDDEDDDSFQDATQKKNSIHLMFQCRQMWLGHEKIIQGDVVRLVPETDIDNGIETALFVTSLGYRMQNLENADPDCDAYLIGRHMTTKKPSPGTKPFVTAAMSYRELEAKGFPKCMRGYNWYDVNGQRDDNYSVSPSRVVGRCYEKVAMQVMVWAGDLDIGLKGLLAIRKWGRKHTDHVDFVWAAPKDEKGVRFTLDDRIDMGLDRNIALSAANINHTSSHNQNGHTNPMGHDKSKIVSETASESDHFNKMSIISDHDRDDDDEETDTFMREALEESAQGSVGGSEEASDGREEVSEVQRRYKKARIGESPSCHEL